jgi:hypothetical protein
MYDIFPKAIVWCWKQGTSLPPVYTRSSDAALFSFTNLPAGTYTLLAETWIDGARYSATAVITMADGEVKLGYPMFMTRN